MSQFFCAVCNAHLGKVFFWLRTETDLWDRITRNRPNLEFEDNSRICAKCYRRYHTVHDMPQTPTAINIPDEQVDHHHLDLDFNVDFERDLDIGNVEIPNEIRVIGSPNLANAEIFHANENRNEDRNKYCTLCPRRLGNKIYRIHPGTKLWNTIVQFYADRQFQPDSPICAKCYRRHYTINDVQRRQHAIDLPIEQIDHHGLSPRVNIDFQDHLVEPMEVDDPPNEIRRTSYST